MLKASSFPEDIKSFGIPGAGKHIGKDLPSMSRDEAQKLIEANGGKVNAQIISKLNLRS